MMVDWSQSGAIIFTSPIDVRCAKEMRAGL